MLDKYYKWDDILSAPSFLINLERRPERLEFSYNNLKNAGFSNINIVKAVDSLKIDIEEEVIRAGFKKIRNDNVKLSTKGEIAALLSHIDTMRKAIDMDVPIFNVFEDDIEFHNDWQKLAPKFFEITPNDWDILYMGSQIEYNFLKPNSLFHKLHNNNFYKNISKIFFNQPSYKMGDILKIPVFCNHAFTLHRNAAERIIQWMLAQEVGAYVNDCMLIDGMKGEPIVKDYNFVHYAWNNYRFPSLKTEPNVLKDKRNSGLVFQNENFGSDLQNRN